LVGKEVIPRWSNRCIVSARPVCRGFEPRWPAATMMKLYHGGRPVAWIVGCRRRGVQPLSVVPLIRCEITCPVYGALDVGVVEIRHLNDLLPDTLEVLTVLEGCYESFHCDVKELIPHVGLSMVLRVRATRRERGGDEGSQRGRAGPGSPIPAVPTGVEERGRASRPRSRTSR